MRLIPAEAGKFKRGQLYVAFSDVGRLVTHHLTRNQGFLWIDDHDDTEMDEAQLLDGWYLIDPSDEPKRDKFWEKCYLAALMGFCARDSYNRESRKLVSAMASDQADACVAERNARS